MTNNLAYYNFDLITEDFFNVQAQGPNVIQIYCL